MWVKQVAAAGALCSTAVGLAVTVRCLVHGRPNRAGRPAPKRSDHQRGATRPGRQGPAHRYGAEDFGPERAPASEEALESYSHDQQAAHYIISVNYQINPDKVSQI